MRKVMLFLFCLSPLVHAEEQLPALSAEAQNLTVSGLSSGAFMAVQFHVVHSAQVRGAGVLAGGPYYCAGGSAWTAMSSCMSPGFFTSLPKTESLRAEVDKQAAKGAIDPPEGLRSSRVWLFTGGQDSVVKSEVVEAARAFYQQWLPASSIAWESLPQAAHGMIAPGATVACGTLQSPFINHCGEFDAAGRLLAHLLGPLQPKAKPDDHALLLFDQSRFVQKGTNLADTAYVYVPAACRAGGCRIHVAFHGCRQNAAAVHDAFVRQSGYNEWAEANHLIVLYPQTQNDSNGCWDWWGYTGTGYHTRAAPQIDAVWKMIEQLQRPASAVLN